VPLLASQKTIKNQDLLNGLVVQGFPRLVAMQDKFPPVFSYRLKGRKSLLVTRRLLQLRCNSDQETGEFRDFVLGRLGKPKPAGPARSKANDDRDWQSFVELKIAPHPRLTPAQAKAIALDYGISKGKAVIRVRRALLFYALRHLGLDVGPDIRPPHEQHIVLVNRGEIDALRSTPAQT